jgi:2-methylisocitrate lyase-like PEP mutase family enzyme
MSDVVGHVGRIARNLNVPVICDADTGYGGVNNVACTVREFEASGISAIHLEDQVTPKRCGLLEQGIPVITCNEQVLKIRAAFDARESMDFLLIARTDAKSMHGLEEAARRGRAFIEAGADAVLVMGADTPEELHYVADIVKAPLVSVIQESPPSSDLTDALLAEVGCIFALHAGTLRYAVVKTMSTALKVLYYEHSTEAVRDMMADFDEYNAAVGLHRWLDLERHYLGDSVDSVGMSK